MRSLTLFYILFLYQYVNLYVYSNNLDFTIDTLDDELELLD